MHLRRHRQDRLAAAALQLFVAVGVAVLVAVTLVPALTPLANLARALPS